MECDHVYGYHQANPYMYIQDVSECVTVSRSGPWIVLTLTGDSVTPVQSFKWNRCGFVSCSISAYPRVVKSSLSLPVTSEAPVSYRWSVHAWSAQVFVLYCLLLSSSFLISIDAHVCPLYIDHVALRVVCVWPIPVLQQSFLSLCDDACYIDWWIISL